MAKTKSEKLMRCVCGEVFKIAESSKCPSCGGAITFPKQAETPKKVKSKEKMRQTREAEASQDARKPLALKPVLIIAGILLVAAFFYAQSRQSEFVSSNEVSSVPVQGRDGSAARVDRDIVGTWIFEASAGANRIEWNWKINAGGTYQFTEIGGANTRHSGNISATGGLWSLESTMGMPWSDGGNYKISNGNVLVLTGRLGTSTWRRE